MPLGQNHSDIIGTRITIIIFMLEKIVLLAITHSTVRLTTRQVRKLCQ